MQSHPSVERLEDRIAPASFIVAALSVSIADVTKAEGSTGPTAFDFIVSLSSASATDVTVDYATSAGSASDASDFTPAAGTLTIPAGMLSGTIQVTVDGDTASESNETFNVTLSNPSANAALGDGLAAGTILNDDANSVKARTIKYTDPEGDLVTIAVDVGSLGAENVVFVPSGNLGGVQLVELNLSGSEFINASVTVTAKRGPAGGDGFANIGYVNAGGTTLRAVAINGDVGQVDALHVNTLTVHSLGRLGLSTQAAGGSLVSNFNGGLGKLIVKGDIVDASVFSTADIGSVSIRGDLVGGSEDYSGTIEAAGRIGSVAIRGSLVGGDGEGSGGIIARTAGSIQIHGDIRHGTIVLSGNDAPGSNTVALALAALAVTGNVNGASILAGYDRSLTPVNADVRIGTVSVGGAWIASDLVSGIAAGNDVLFGTDDDVHIADGSSIVSRIASISIRGQVFGTVDSSIDAFGFVAEKIGAFRTGATLFPLTTGIDVFAIGATGDVNIREGAADT
jgi:hypothetical protein